eukprot:4216464-Pleurochrysis_carterae.AAC.1
MQARWPMRLSPHLDDGEVPDGGCGRPAALELLRRVGVLGGGIRHHQRHQLLQMRRGRLRSLELLALLQRLVLQRRTERQTTFTQTL